jgi:hypothetical protein
MVRVSVTSMVSISVFCTLVTKRSTVGSRRAAGVRLLQLLLALVLPLLLPPLLLPLPLMPLLLLPPPPLAVAAAKAAAETAVRTGGSLSGQASHDASPLLRRGVPASETLGALQTTPHHLCPAAAAAAVVGKLGKREGR